MIGVTSGQAKLADVVLDKSYYCTDYLPKELKFNRKAKTQLKKGEHDVQQDVVEFAKAITLKQYQIVRRTELVRKKDKHGRAYEEYKTRVSDPEFTGKSIAVKIPAGAEIGYFTPDSQLKCIVKNITVNRGVPGQLNIHRNGTMSVRLYA